MKNLSILFATTPKEGHFSPLTSLAIYLTRQGHDVRWYAGGNYGKKVGRLGLYHYPFVKAKTFHQDFLHHSTGIVEDLKEIYDNWSFDIMVHDSAFPANTKIQDILPVKTVAVGVMPSYDSGTALPSPGLGNYPVQRQATRWVQPSMSEEIQDALFQLTPSQKSQPRQVQFVSGSNSVGAVPDSPAADLYLQIGVPGLDNPTNRLKSGIRYVGAMLPYNRGRKYPFGHAALALKARRVVLVTQGTVEKDVENIIVPTLEAYKNDPTTLVIATTGGSQTEELQRRYPQDNFIIEDFIDFQSVMPYANVFVTNGGYGGVMLALQHNLPIVVAGNGEGREEVAARVAYCKAGLDLKTETPSPSRIQRAIEQVLTDSAYWTNVRKLGREFAAYQANELAARYIAELAEATPYIDEASLFQVA